MPAVAAPFSPSTLLRNVGVESALLIGVLGLAALLANTSAGSLMLFFKGQICAAAARMRPQRRPA
jgi:hypothetical protein